MCVKITKIFLKGDRLNVNILESLIYGLISGLTEFMPISSQGHQALLKQIFGVTSPDPIRDIMVHIAILAAVFVTTATYLDRIRRERKIRSRRKRNTQADRNVAQELQLIRTAAIPMLIGIVVSAFTVNWGKNLGWLAIFFILNGVILYIPEHLAHGNKSAGLLGPLDSLLIGLGGALSFIPGISRVGGSLSCAIARGADQEKAYNWILVLSIPALVLILILDVIGIFFTGFGTITFVTVVGWFLSSITAFGSAIAGIYLMRIITAKSSITALSYYCWGVASLSFLLFLFV